MVLLVIVAVISSWVFIGLITAGFMEGYGRRHWPYLYTDKEGVRKNRRESLYFSLLLSPIAFVLVFFSSEFFKNGWALSSRLYSIEEARNIMREEMQIYARRNA